MNNFSKQTLSLLLTGSLALAMAMNQHVHAKAGGSKDPKPAGRSTKLVVDPDFNFATSDKITLDISVTNDLNRPMPGIMLKVFAVEDPKNLGGVKRQLKTTLLTIVRTDQAGNAQREIEIPQHYRDIRIEKMVLARDSVQHIQLNGQERIIVDM